MSRHRNIANIVNEALQNEDYDDGNFNILQLMIPYKEYPEDDDEQQGEYTGKFILYFENRYILI